MSRPQYQIHVRHYTFYKTRLIKHIRPKLYNDVPSANNAAYKWLHELGGEGEVVRVLETKDEGMQIQGTADWEKQDEITAWAEVMRVEEEKIEEDRSSSADQEVCKELERQKLRMEE